MPPLATIRERIMLLATIVLLSVERGIKEQSPRRVSLVHGTMWEPAQRVPVLRHLQLPTPRLCARDLPRPEALALSLAKADMMPQVRGSACVERGLLQLVCALRDLAPLRHLGLDK